MKQTSYLTIGLTVLSVGVLFSQSGTQKKSEDWTKEALEAEIKLLRNENSKLLNRLHILEDMLREYDVSRYNLIDYSKIRKKTLKEQIIDSSLIIYKKLSSDKTTVDDEVYKIGEGIALPHDTSYGYDSSQRAEDMRKYRFDGELIFYGKSPPLPMNVFPVRNGIVLHEEGISLANFKELVVTTISEEKTDLESPTPEHP